jgi:hypothetical protein
VPALWLGVYTVCISCGYLFIGAAPGTVVFYCAVLVTLIGYDRFTGVAVAPRRLVGAAVALAGVAVLAVAGRRRHGAGRRAAGGDRDHLGPVVRVPALDLGHDRGHRTAGDPRPHRRGRRRSSASRCRSPCSWRPGSSRGDVARPTR